MNTVHLNKDVKNKNKLQNDTLTITINIKFESMQHYILFLDIHSM